MKIGIFGATFDPIHCGHLLAAAGALDALKLDRMLLMVAARPPHKTPLVSAEARHEMVVLATAKHPRMEASRLELDRPGFNYSVDTLDQLKELYPEAELYFVTGVDAYKNLTGWKDWQRLAQLAQLVAVPRPGYTIEPIGVQLLDIPVFNLSSTEIRRRLNQGLSVSYMIPEEVEAYVYKHRLYRDA